MAKIPTYTENTSPADGDLLISVDVSDTTDDPTGTSKRIQVSKLRDLSEDTSPQLGAALDVDGQEIVSIGGTDVVLHSDNNVVVTLGDAAGADKLSIRDSSGTEQAYIDSDGSISLQLGQIVSTSSALTLFETDLSDEAIRFVLGSSSGNIESYADGSVVIRLAGKNYPYFDNKYPLLIGATATSQNDPRVVVGGIIDNTVGNSNTWQSGSGVNAHAFVDETSVTRGGNIGYNSFDSRFSVSGTNGYDHFASFQSRPTIGTSGTVDRFSAWQSLGIINTGTVTTMRHLECRDLTGSGTIGTQVGLYIETLGGTGNPSNGNTNYAISIGDSDASQNLIHVGVTGDPIFAWDESNDRFDLNKGLDITGNITVSGTVDGRDLATDGTKLDGIEASADVTDETNVINALDGATLTDLGTPASGDLILLQDASDSNNLKVAQFSAFGGGGGGMSDLVDDTTPQLGGSLDVNGNEITGAIDLHSTGDVIVELGDAAGTNKLSIRDSGAVEVASIDSDGNFTVNDLTASGMVFTEKSSASTPSTGEFELWAHTDGTLRSTNDGGTSRQYATLDAITLAGAMDVNGQEIQASSGDIVFQLSDAAGASMLEVEDSAGVAQMQLTSDGDVTFTGDAFVADLTTTGVIELGHASDTTVSRSSAGVLAVEGVVVPTISSTNTLTNKTIKNSDNTMQIYVEKHAASHTIDATECYGGVHYVTSAATITLPAAVDGMSVTIITVGAIAVSVDPNASDLIMLDGTALDDGDKITNTSTSGDMAVLTYYDATGWYAATNGWTDGGA